MTVPANPAYRVHVENLCEGLGMRPLGRWKINGADVFKACAHEHATHAGCGRCDVVFDLRFGASIRVHFEKTHKMAARDVLEMFNGGQAGRDRVDALLREQRRPWPRLPDISVRVELPEYITSRIEVDARGCWIWAGPKNVAGYGIISVAGKQRLAHREVKRIVAGFIPAGRHVCHRCDNPPCCNPAHLFIGTPKENAIDSRNKGRGRSKLTAPQVIEIRSRHKKGVSMSRLARDYGVSRQAIGLIVTGRTWADVG